MEVTNLFVKTVKKKPVEGVEKLVVTSKAGIVGSTDVENSTPRQVLTTSKETLDFFNLKPGELKENIVVEGFGVDKLESGDCIQVGKVPIRITFHCEPCGYVESLQKGLLKKIEFRRGVLGVFLEDGEIKIGDKVKKLDKKYSSIPYKIQDRFLWLTKQIPEGKVVSYKTMIEALGLSQSYTRIIPAFIKSNDANKFPFYRIVDSKGYVIKYVGNQTSKLISEGVVIESGKVNLQKYKASFEGLYISN